VAADRDRRPDERPVPPGRQRRCRYETEITLTQHVTANSLNETLRQTKAARGLKTRTTRVKAGEETLYDVARRYYGDPSRASDIARANFKNGGPARARRAPESGHAAQDARVSRGTRRS
jgi:hypothetical protein